MSDLTRPRRVEQVRLYDRRLKSLHAIGRAIRAMRAPDIAAQTALCHIRRLVPCAQAIVLAFDFEAAQALVLAASPDGADLGAPCPLGPAEVADALRCGRPYLVEDVEVCPLPPIAALIFKPANTRSFMRAPLIAGGRLIGVIGMAANKPRALAQRHVTLACEVADQLAIGLQNNHLFQQVQANSQQLRALSRQLMEIQENERRHIARELHDEIGQSLTAVKINLETIMRLPNTHTVEQPLEESIAIVERLLEQVRAISLNLRPSMLDDLGLESALRWYLARLAERVGFAAKFIADSIEPHLPPELATACFRVAQEALTNVVRHAHALHVKVDLRQRGRTLRLRVSDDGVGFDTREACARAAHGTSLGLVGMRERVLLAGGELMIESAPERGTTIHAHFPLPPAL